MAQEKITRGVHLLLLLIILLGIYLRLFQLGKHDFWFDEAWKIEISRDLYTSYLDHRPLFNFLLHFWRKVFGEREFNLRLLPASLGILTLPLFYLLSRETLPEKFSLLPLLLLVLSPFHIWYSQELRSYTLTCFLVISTTYMYLLWLKRGEKWFPFFTLSLSLTLYTSYLTFLILPVQFIYTGLFYPHRLKRWSLALSISLLLFLPRIYPLYFHYVFLKQSFWAHPPTLLTLLITYENLLLGYNSLPPFYHASFLLSFPLLIYSIRFSRRYSFFFLSLLFSPLILLFLISLKFPLFLPRLFLPFSPFVFLLISLGAIRMRKHLSFLLISSLIILEISSLINHYQNLMPSPISYHVGVYPKREFRPLLKFIRERAEEGDIIAHTNPGTATPFLFYSRRLKVSLSQYYFILPYYQDPYWRRNLLEWKFPPWLTIPLPPVMDISRNKPDYPRIWLISSDWARDWRLDKHSLQVWNEMKKNMKLVEDKWMEGVRVTLFERGKSP